MVPTMKTFLLLTRSSVGLEESTVRNLLRMVPTSSNISQRQAVGLRQGEGGYATILPDDVI